jgi:E3 ubiquitin-protein ligase synoviolin
MVSFKTFKYGAFGAFVSLGAYKKLIHDADILSFLSHYKVFNATVVVGFLVVNFLKWLIFGKLSSTEIQNLRQKFDFTMWEFFCGFAIFYFQSDSFQNVIHTFLKFAGLFLCILLLKCFHYLSSDRVSQHFNQHNFGKLIVLRFALGIILLNFIDGLLIFRFIKDANHSVLRNIFGFEILHMCPLILLTCLKFGLNCYYLDDWNNNKFKIIVISEFIVNLVRFILICIFAMVFLYRYTVPLHIVPSTYFSLKVLVEKARNLLNFKKNQLILNKLKMPDKFDHNCTICFEDFLIDNDLRELNCRHVFHYQCLNQWINCSKACPVCRDTL